MVFQLTQKLVFPNPYYGEPDGLLAVGGDLSVDRLILAYSNGIFPCCLLYTSPSPRDA